VTDPDPIKADDPKPADPPAVPSDPPPSVPPTQSGVVDPIASVPTPAQGVQMPPAVAPQANYAGFWIRFLAIIIDCVILGIVTSIINSIFGAGFAFVPTTSDGTSSAGTFGFLAGMMGLSFIINLVINYGYYVILTGLYGATLGKMVLGLRVVDANGQKIGIPKAVLREIIGKWISGIVFALGYIWVAFDEKKQGWHDKIAGTYVVKVR
jgi:uncharacterized RDD family membrane protein YckC